MTISIWRYSHLALAVSSFLFIALASVTGIILAFDPVTQKMQPYRSDHFDELTLAKVIPVIKDKYKDVTALTVDYNHFVTVKATDTAGKQVEVYVNAATGAALGPYKKQSDFFQWVTALHRSLFLHETGRIFIGVTAFLLFLIAISGTILVIKRQRGVKRFFTKVVKDNFAQYAHVTLGRLSLIPIIIIALSGTYLSLENFGIIGEKKIAYSTFLDTINEEPVIKTEDIPLFKNIRLADVESIEFPFSEAPEDPFVLKLKDRVVVMNQVTGDVLMEVAYPKIHQFTSLSMNLHTGRASAIWAIVLAIASINILFFIWSGFAITLKRRANRVKNKYKAGNSNYIILVGSENGSSFRYAKAIHEQLIKNGHSCFLTELNNYTSFPQAEQLIIVTATYGLGNPPTNAAKFIQRLEKYPQTQPIHFSVVGFGSHAYPDFCKFAFEVNNLLAKQTWATPLLEIHTVNDRSPVEFGVWADFWSQKAGVSIDLSQAELNTAPENLQEFTVIHKQIADTAEPSFLLQLQPSQKTNFQSGDLLAIYPANDHRERLYSLGKVNGQLQLSVKLHTGGLGSNYLHALESGTSIQARIVPNGHFHFPAKAPMVIMVANGTGIAPFLGMIDENRAKTDCRLYCGFREAAAFELYINKLEKAVSLQQLKALHIAYSREGARQYVSHLLQRDADSIAAALANGAVIMLCGSLSMQKDVIALLETICMEKNNRPVSYYQSHGQVLMDCY